MNLSGKIFPDNIFIHRNFDILMLNLFLDEYIPAFLSILKGDI
jgi:hypothetical protein